MRPLPCALRYTVLFCGLGIFGQGCSRPHPADHQISRAPSAIAAVQPAISNDPKLRSFNEFIPLPDSGQLSSDVSLGNIHGLGHLDIVLSTGRHWNSPIRLYFNDGRGNFPASQAIGDRGYKSYGVPLADLNGDSHLDLVVGTDLGEEKPVFFGDGHGRFTLGGTIGNLGPTRNIAVADLNSDGFPDVVVCNRGAQSFVYLNNGKGGFAQRKPFGSSEDSNVTVVVADMNGDGSPDLVVARRDHQQSMVFFNDGKANFGQGTPFGPARADTRALAVGDLRCTGRIDIVACHLDAGTFIYRNDGKGHFSGGIPLSDRSDNFFCLAVADLNRNGNLDIVGGNSGKPNLIFFNREKGSSWTKMEFGETNPDIITYGIAIGDLRASGYPDIVVARTGAPSGIFYSAPAGTKPSEDAKAFVRPIPSAERAILL